MRKHGIAFMLLLMVAAVRLFSETADHCLAAADSLIQGNQLKEAIAMLEECTVKYPEISGLWVKMGQAVGRQAGADFQAGNMDDAMKEVAQSFDLIEKGIVLEENNIEARITYGVMSMEIPVFFGKFNAGVKHLQKAEELLALNPSEETLSDRMMVFYYLGVGYQRQKKVQDAKNSWETLLSISGQGEWADRARDGLAMLKDIPDMKSAENVGNEINDSAELMVQGQKLMAENKFAEARKKFEEVLNQDEKHKDAQIMLIQCIAADAQIEYDHRVYDNQDTRTHLAFDLVREMRKGLDLDPENNQLKLQYGLSCLYMPFFIGKMDEGIGILESMLKDDVISDSVKNEILFGLGYAYMKKGNAYWTNLVKSDQNSESARSVYAFYGLRKTEHENTVGSKSVKIQFHLGFLDQLAPQTALWIEDENGNFIRTLYVSGFAGYAKEKQVTLQQWGESTQFETDGTTAASIDWGTHTYFWDLRDHQGNQVKKGIYKVRLEVSWWPSFRYGLTDIDISVGGKKNASDTQKLPFIPLLQAEYIP